jgi:hypothetical protein
MLRKIRFLMTANTDAEPAAPRTYLLPNLSTLVENDVTDRGDEHLRLLWFSENFTHKRRYCRGFFATPICRSSQVTSAAEVQSTSLIPHHFLGDPWSVARHRQLQL